LSLTKGHKKKKEKKYIQGENYLKKGGNALREEADRRQRGLDHRLIKKADFGP